MTSSTTNETQKGVTVNLYGGNRAHRRKMEAVERKLPYSSHVSRVNNHFFDCSRLRAEKIANHIKKVQEKKAIRLEQDPNKKRKMTKKRLKTLARNRAKLERKKIKREKRRIRNLK